MPRNPARANKARKATRGVAEGGALEGRIGAGVWRTRKIMFDKSEGVRPTKDRVRQAVFNLLATRVALDGALVVDLCCGSGAYGLEALSRGAARAVLVDKDVRLAKRNAESLTAEAEVVAGDVRTWRPEVLADVVFLDPPYKSGLVAEVWARRAELAKVGSWWVMEMATGERFDLTGLAEVTERVYGASTVVVGTQN